MQANMIPNLYGTNMERMETNIIQNLYGMSMERMEVNIVHAALLMLMQPIHLYWLIQKEIFMDISRSTNIKVIERILIW